MTVRTFLDRQDKDHLDIVTLEGGQNERCDGLFVDYDQLTNDFAKEIAIVSEDEAITSSHAIVWIEKALRDSNQSSKPNPQPPRRAPAPSHHLRSSQVERTPAHFSSEAISRLRQEAFKLALIFAERYGLSSLISKTNSGIGFVVTDIVDDQLVTENPNIATCWLALATTSGVFSAPAEWLANHLPETSELRGFVQQDGATLIYRRFAGSNGDVLSAIITTLNDQDFSEFERLLTCRRQIHRTIERTADSWWDDCGEIRLPDKSAI